MQTIDVSAGAWEEVYPGVRRWMASGQRMTVTLYRFAPGATFPLHRHAQEQLALVLRGLVVFHNATARVACQPHQVIVIDPDEPHAATAGPEGAEVVSVVSPARRQADDYVVGDRV
jgi:quercetin dioxygenase-like cupin family protein